MVLFGILAIVAAVIVEAMVLSKRIDLGNL